MRECRQPAGFSYLETKFTVASNPETHASCTDLGVNYTFVIAIARLTFDRGTIVAAMRTRETRRRDVASWRTVVEKIRRVEPRKQ